MSPFVERIESHVGDVGGLPIQRALPNKGRRAVGAWCFADHAGPATLPREKRMNVGPHPHTGLSTFSWMIEGEILHRDSLGSEQVLRAGEVNLMTAGRGISHSEESLSDRIHLAQLWIALPDAERDRPASFQHFPDLPRATLDEGWDATVLVGEFAGRRSPLPSFTPLLGVDLAAAGPACAALALDSRFEHGFMLLEGEVDVSPAGHAAVETVRPGTLLYVGTGCESVELRCAAGARLLLLGGEPWAAPPLLWWNFVGREPAEMQAWAMDWAREDGGRFGIVRGYSGPRIAVPPVPALRKP
ncbi:pirin family protein [Pelomonas aquatica]|jgi:redox-sensitive bicupin YhaK (pirin superfamily)|uniref:Pirin family protein n=1 Tax=Pelomonas aquatica TaxID=431058 RepID=A0A9X4LFG5_9BURK|nr:pirin family protein [Pelomonas aquatica]MCY4755167.1 pirin family protein [Pelomonas aquatica]MDG0862477.1 pirin family protein [Pelomonas aquatica]